MAPIEKSPAPDKWAVYEGFNNQLHYVSLQDVIGLKYPDEVTKGVTLRLSNGHFVATSESLSKVLSDLNAVA